MPDSNGEILIDIDGAVIVGSAEGVTLRVQEGVSELTIKNVNITSREHWSALIMPSGSITLNVEGSNTLTGALSGCGVNADVFTDLTINLVNGAELTTQGRNGLTAGPLAVTGSGTLEAVGGPDPDVGNDGIWLDGNLTIGESVTVTAEGGDSSAGNGGHGLLVRGSVENNGTLTATDGNDGESGEDGNGGDFGGDGMHGGNGAPPMINPGDIPQTGDSSKPALWLALLGLAGAGMLLLRRKALG